MVKRSLSVLLILLLSIGLASQTLKQKPSSQLARFLVDENIWGKDTPAVFAWLDSWRQINMPQIILYPDKVMAGISSTSEKQADHKVAQLDSAAKAPQPRLKPFYAKAFTGRIPAAPPVESTFTTNPEDDSLRVTWSKKSLRFLREGLTLSGIFRTYGKPERTTSKLVQNKRDTRPILLTFYHYANGAIQFVESDPAPDPDLVSRIVLDVNTVAAELFEGGEK